MDSSKPTFARHDASANAPADIPTHEKKSAQAMWDSIFRETPNANTIMIAATMLGQPRDPDDNTILTLCTPFEPGRLKEEELRFEIVDGEPIAHVPENASLPSHNNPTVRVESPHRLCSPCLDAFDYFFRYLELYKPQPVEEEPYPLPQEHPNAVIHHSSPISLMVSNQMGCFLCKQLIERLPERFTESSWLEMGRIEMCWRSSSRGINPQKHIYLWFVVTRPDWLRNQWNYENFFQLHLWPSDKYGSTFTAPTPNGSILNKETADALIGKTTTNSLASREQALAWLSKCNHNKDGKHDDCIARNSTVLPTRLLDVERALCTGILHLVSPKEEPAAFSSDRDYISLSYCWGEGGVAKLPLLISQNLLERHEVGLKLTDLPKTFRNALEIASWFKVKWIWIDCLTILQDSTTDWTHEAEQMSQTYRNALLNISADASGNAQGGCFVERDTADVTPLKMGAPDMHSTWWITPDKRYQFDWMQNVASFSRAWIHRERQLSPRVLHFTDKELIWECSGTPYASDTYPGGAPFRTAFRGDNKYKYQINALQQQRSSDSQQAVDKIYETWNGVCNSFSRKKLTVATDMPVVLSSLAQEFADLLPSDEYIAGLWRSTLPQSLLWMVLSDNGSRSSFIAPSWSWMSTSNSVKLQGRWVQPPILAIRETDLMLKSVNVFGGLAYGALKVTGFLRRIHIFDPRQLEGFKDFHYDISVYDSNDHEGAERLLGTSRTEYDGQLCDYRPDTRGSAWDIFHYCLFVTMRQIQGSPPSSGSRDIEALLLEPASSTLENGAKKFRRMGKISFKDLFSLKMRYKVKADIEETEAAWRALQSEIDKANDDDDDLSGKDRDYPALEDIDPKTVYRHDKAGDFSWLDSLTPESITLV